jgi:acyl-CoA thioesterase I
MGSVMQSVLRWRPLMAYGAKRSLCNLALAAALVLPQAALADPLTLVAFGDSLTAGYGLPPDQGFVPQLEGWLHAKGADVAVINAGVSGDTTAGGASRIDWTLTPEVDAMILTLGGNDLLRGIDPAEARRNLDAILTAADAHHLPVMLVAMQALGNYGPDYKRDFDAIYPALANKHHAMLADNFFAALLAPGTSQATFNTWMQPDGIHPNAEGVAKIVAALGPEVLILLKSAAP